MVAEEKVLDAVGDVTGRRGQQEVTSRLDEGWPEAPLGAEEELLDAAGNVRWPGAPLTAHPDQPYPLNLPPRPERD